MATELKTRASDLYQEDFYAWALGQADLLKAKRFEALDLANLIEEVEGLADLKKEAVISNASVIIEHLLKLQHSPAEEPRRGWADSIIEHRDRLEAGLTPLLRVELGRELERLYVRTRRRTEKRLRLYGEDTAAEALPATCPYTLEQVLDDWWPEA
jgi:hypothetical protein